MLNSDDSDTSYVTAREEFPTYTPNDTPYNPNPLLPAKSRSYKKTSCRWFALLLMCLITFGRYYAYDNPQALESVMTADLHITSLEYNLLYSVFSIPNIILPLLGGIAIDCIGVRFGIVVFALIVIAGQTLVFIGGYFSSYLLILIGRILFGIGGENIGVVQSKIVCKWFNNNEVALAMSIATALSRAGSASNSFVTPKLSHGSDLALPLFVSDMVCVFSLLCGLILIYMDAHSDRIEGIRDSFTKDPNDQVRFQDVVNLDRVFWMLLINSMFVYGALEAFTNVSNDYIQKRYSFSQSAAGNIMTAFYTITMVGTPIFGVVTDKFGHRMRLIFLSNLLLIGGNVLLIALPDCNECYSVLASIIILGLFYGLYGATFWGCPPLVVEQKALGTAFGLLYSAQNLASALVPLAVGVLQDDGYIYVSMLAAGLAVMGTIMVLVGEMFDRKLGRRLTRVYPKNNTQE